MTAIAILQIEDCFALSDGRLVVVPDFPATDGFETPKTFKAQIKKLDGNVIDCKVTLNLTHFNKPASTDIAQRWRIVPEILGVTKNDLSPGDQLCIFDKDVSSALTPETP